MTNPEQENIKQQESDETTQKNKEQEKITGELDNLKNEIKSQEIDKFFTNVGKTSWMGFFKKRKIASDFIGAIKEVSIKDITGLGGLSQYLIPGVINTDFLGKGLSYIAPTTTINLFFKIINFLPEDKQENFMNSVFDIVIKKNENSDNIKGILEGFKKISIGIITAKTSEDLNNLKTNITNENEI